MKTSVKATLALATALAWAGPIGAAITVNDDPVLYWNDLAVRTFGGSTGLFVALALALFVYGVANVAAVAGGVWFTTPRPKQVPAAQPAHGGRS